MDPITKNRQDFERKVAQVRANPDLNDEAMRRMIHEAYEEASRKHQELAEDRRLKESETLTRLERDVMGIRYPFGISDGDKELVLMSYRDAYDRAERTASEAARGGDPGKLTALLERAERSGDSRLAEAVYHVATEKGIRDVADSYLASRPKDKERWEKYTEARLEAESVENLFFGAHAQGPMRPLELDGLPAPAQGAPTT